MSDGIKLNTLPTVTNLDSSDTVIVSDSSGYGKRITKTNLLKNRVTIVPEEGGHWVRIASFNGSAGALISIHTVWYNTPGCRILFDILLHKNSLDYCDLNVLSAMSNKDGIIWVSKARVVQKLNQTGYLDLYFNLKLRDYIYVDFINSFEIGIMSPVIDPQIPEGYSTKEFDITKPAWGGVKRSASIGYKSNPKGGGAPHDRSHTPQRRAYTLLVDRGTILGVAKADPFGRDSAADTSQLLYRGLHPTRDISVGREHHDHGDTTVAKRVMALRDNGSVRQKCGHNPKDNRHRGRNDVRPHAPQRQVEALETDPSGINLTIRKEVACI